jgi:hypothetical protein
MDLLRKGSRPLFEGREFVIFAQRLVDMNTLSLEIVLDRAGNAYRLCHAEKVATAR